MQTVFRLNANEIDNDFLETFRKLFKNKTVKITVEEESTPNQKELWKELERVRKKYPPMIVSPDINLSELANEVNL